MTVASGTSSSLRLYRPRPASVQIDDEGIPTTVGRAKVESVREHWLVEDRWWTTSPLRRRYFELAMDGGAVLVVFREFASGRWYAQKGA
jgi:hypothetical protein